MGEIRRYHCKCGYEATINTGMGFLAISEGIIKRFFPKEHTILKQRAGWIAMESVPATCDRCKKIVSVQALRWEDEEGNIESYYKECPECREGISPSADTDNVSCPLCGAKMHYELAGYWD